ncbi:hypothetical protein [Planktosalinus lacus]|uniref:Uncharacterized protein n=1 Tax=Planktosalinus lacus TaxID=1526573 RepID=A0A8J2Y7V9_9FLAO|nr:hypothetical protein [Planktosalinus lacus]GGD83241.1 hypothetical protein GCM10011312_04210 [Planktosalinus lacus]
MKTLAITLIALFGLQYFYAQQPIQQKQVEYLMQFKFQKTTTYKDIDLNTLNYIGSPYTNDNYLAGDIYHKNKLVAENVPLRYNALVDEMEFKPKFETPDNESSALMKSPEIDVRIGQKVFVFVPYQGGVEKGGYFEVLRRGEKYDLFKKYNKKYIPEQEAKTSMTKDRPAKFIDNPVYYIVRGDGKFIELPDKNRKFSKLFSGNENEINNYIKSKNLDLKNESDLLKVIAYIDSSI